MTQVFSLQRTRISGGIFGSTYLEEFCDGDGNTLFRGEAPSGYLSRDIVMASADGAIDLRFGPNRAIAPSSHVLRSADGAVIATFRHGLVQSAIGGRSFDVDEAAHDRKLELVPGETVGKSFPEQVANWRRDQLAVVLGGQIIGSADRRAPTDGEGMSAADVARGLVNLARLPGAVIRQMKNRNAPQTPRTVAQVTL